ncbi:hypothetical protein HK102_005396 [Quaeritorhiza haematococci]|nr:hypothetical protein HK102_005396 [Quaeritorhiza haematococci]
MMKPGRSKPAGAAAGGLGKVLGRDASVDNLAQIASGNNGSTAPQTDDTIVQTLAARFARDDVYTKIGNRVVVAVNPGRPLTIHSDTTSKEYASHQKQTATGLPGEPGSKRPMPAHIFDLSGAAYHHLTRLGEDQTIVLSGETGSGKSESHKLLARNLCDLSKTSKKRTKVHSGVLKLDSIFSAFGCAQTPANRNASRFGRYTEYQFDTQGRMVGAKCLEYLLEKTRVTSVMSADERNFHIFYQLLGGATAEERSQLMLSDPHSFHYLAQSKYKYTTPEDATAFAELRENLKSFGIGKRHIEGMLQLLSGILHLGNITFVDDPKNPNEQCSVKNFEKVEQVADLLGIQPAHLSQALCNRTKLIHGEMCSVLLDSEGAERQRDLLAQTLYSLLFSWLVEHINKKLCKAENEWTNYIGVLDFPGFGGSDRRNSNLHQLLINFANEKIFSFTQQQLWEQAAQVFSMEGLDIMPPGRTAPNQAILALLENAVGEPVGILPLLEIGCAKSHTSHDPDALAAERVYERHSNNPDFVAKKKMKYQFGIRHYAGRVDYDTKGWIDANSEIIPTDAVTLFRGSSEMPASFNTFVRNLFSNKAISAISHPQDPRNIVVATQLGGNKPLRKPSMKRKSKRSEEDAEEDAKSGTSEKKKDQKEKNADDDEEVDDILIDTVSSQFRTAFSELFDAFLETRTWFAIHVRSSEVPQGKFTVDTVKRQVNSTGIAEMLSAPSVLYTVNFPFDTFVARYSGVLAKVDGASQAAGSKQKCELLLRAYQFGPKDAVLGRTNIFMAETAWRAVDDQARGLEERKGDADDTAPGTPEGSEAGSVAPSVQGTPYMERKNAGGRRKSQYVKSDGLGSSGSDAEDSFSELEDDWRSEYEYGSSRAPSEYMSGKASRAGSPDVEFMGEASIKKGQSVRKTNEDDKRATRVDEEPAITPARKRWVCCTWFLTWPVCGCCMARCGKMKRRDIQMAWREKLALNLIIYLMCAGMLFYIIGLGRIVCPKQNLLSQGELEGKTDINRGYVSMYGSYYRLPEVIKEHISKGYLGGEAAKATTLGQDVSVMFYKTTHWDKYCPGLPQPRGWDNLLSREPPLRDAIKVWYPHQLTEGGAGRFKDYIAMVAGFKKGEVARNEDWVKDKLKADEEKNRLVIAYGKVYDVSAYFQGNPTPFLGPNLTTILVESGRRALDITQRIEREIRPRNREGEARWRAYMRCMDGMFYTGVVDNRLSPQCVFSNYVLLASTIILVAVIGFKFLAALQFGGGGAPEDHDKFVILQVPCYTEGPESLLRTFDSLAFTRYDDKRKLLFVIADGMIIGSGNDKPTPRIVLDILGVSPSVDPEPKQFQSLGEGSKQNNYAKVYSGIYKVQGRQIPFIVVVKVGKVTERSRPGNRGKRDSQLILMRFLSRVHFDSEMNPLELEIYHHMKNIIGVHPSFYEYVLMVDADTEVMQDGINRLISAMIGDSQVMGMCGETLIANEMGSWVTMIQVYEYFISHHMAKAFESLFGSVTCLPGCFCMYRVRTPTNNIPLIISPAVIHDYSENTVDTLHKKNLLHLGEDRYLTTLMMKHFPHLKLTFTADAKCMTFVPDRWSVFISQRRRWINSTVHNLLELLMLPQLCGFCCFSLRFVVFLDLFATLVQPASLVYIGYLVFSLLTDEEANIPLISLIMLGAIYGLQVVMFILKREWQHIGWMLIYLLAMPIYAFYLPIYSFWRFDDFSWGNTRVVTGEAGKKVYAGEVEDFDTSSIPLKKWVEYETELIQKAAEAQAQAQYLPTFQEAITTPPVMPAMSVHGGSVAGMPMVPPVPLPPPVLTGSVYGGMGPAASPYPSAAVMPYYAPSYAGSVYGGGVPAAFPIPAAPGSVYAGSVSGMRNRSPTRANAASMPSDEEILAEIRHILSVVNLATVTKKQVRQELSKFFGVDLSPKRDYITACIERVLKGEL